MFWSQMNLVHHLPINPEIGKDESLWWTPEEKKVLELISHQISYGRFGDDVPDLPILTDELGMTNMMQTFIGALLAGHLLDLQKNLHSSEDTKGQYSFNFDLPVNDYHIGFAIGWTKKEAYIGMGVLMFIVGLFVGYSLFF